MNELITLEINSKNKLKLLDLLNESNLVVEILNKDQTYSVVRPEDHADMKIDPQPKVLDPFNYSISITT